MSVEFFSGFRVSKFENQSLQDSKSLVHPRSTRWKVYLLSGVKFCSAGVLTTFKTRFLSLYLYLFLTVLTCAAIE